MSVGRRGGRPGVVLAAGLVVGLGGLAAARYLSAAGAGATPAPRWPACPDPVAVAWPGGERLGCRADLEGLLEEASEAAGCTPSEPPALRAGQRLRLARETGGSCRQQVEPLDGSALLALGLPIDLNRARARDLEAVEGLGPRRARAIVEDREARGPFPSVDALVRVKGIGPSTLAAVRAKLTVGPPREEGREPERIR